MENIATKDSWKSEPFGDVVEIAYSAQFSAQEFKKIQAGLIPEAMEDKWFIYFNEEYLLLHRSWTGEPVYKFQIQQTDEGYSVTTAYISAEYFGDDNVGLLDFLVNNLLLGNNIPFPNNEPNEQTPGVAQHIFSGTGFSEIKTYK
jgi:hypothetical protein